jgi:RNA polymerase sigma factor (sigma-70 family)
MKTKEFKVMNAVKNTVMNTRHELAMANHDLIDMVIYGSKVGSKIVKMCTFLTPEDFHQIGYEALYKAACRYNGARGAAFETYAYVCIENAFISAVRELESVVRLPRNCEDEVLFDSLDAELNRGKHVANTYMRNNRELVSQLIKEADLDAREQHILCNKYDLMLAKEPLSTQQLADYYHLTPQSINRICRQAIEKLKKVSA